MRRYLIYGTVILFVLTVSLPAFTQDYFAILQKGMALYEKNCSACHQADAIGEPGVAPSLVNPEFLRIASQEFLKNTIRDGREGTGMPPFDHLGALKIKMIVTYLQSEEKLPNQSTEVDGQPEAVGDAAFGRIWYMNICSTCHGSIGNGYDSEGTGTAIGLPSFLQSVSDGFIRETIKKGRSNTRMLPFQGPEGIANLTSQQIDDIIVYLRQQAKRR